MRFLFFVLNPSHLSTEPHPGWPRSHGSSALGTGAGWAALGPFLCRNCAHDTGDLPWGLILPQPTQQQPVLPTAPIHEGQWGQQSTGNFPPEFPSWPGRREGLFLLQTPQPLPALHTGRQPGLSPPPLPFPPTATSQKISG